MIDYLSFIDYSLQDVDEMNLTVNERIMGLIKGKAVILTMGHYGIWKQIGDKNNMPIFYGPQMCSDTKYFVSKFLQDKGTQILAFGDSMNDYYMLKQAHKGYLVLKKDGNTSASLKEKNLEGLLFV